MQSITTEIAVNSADAAELDDLLWRVLWRPLGLPRNVRRNFSVDGEHLELASKAEGRIVGGLVAVWTSENDVELRHAAVKEDAWNQGTGRNLVAALVKIVTARGCCRIHTIARNTSTGFFRKLGFKTVPGSAPVHPVFKKHGITFEHMQRIVEPAGEGDALQRS
jgi:N-acetylglutamate synthase-like GNAT family acetyltransferase